MSELTQRQAAVLDFIRGFHLDRGYAPTLREIGDQFGIRSTNGVRDHLTALARKGHLRLHAGVSRGVVLVGENGEESQAADGRPVTDGVALQVQRDELVTEVEALRTLLHRVASAGRRLPFISPEMAVILGDVRQVLKGPRAKAPFFAKRCDAASRDARPKASDGNAQPQRRLA